MIDSGASNNIMSFKVMETLGLGVDTRQGGCRAMDAREVPIIGTINALPFRLAAYLDEELTISPCSRSLSPPPPPPLWDVSFKEVECYNER